MSISIAFNMPIIPTKSTIECVEVLLPKVQHGCVSKVGRKSRHFMFLGSPQFGSICLTCT